ncbi:MAG: hypothetical protein KBC64_07445 [Simkaniaceae bacterium]|nr:hypothetical protein [Simkaniaceae bacterium]
MRWFFFSVLICSYLFSIDIDYSHCESIQDVITLETQHLAIIDCADHDTLAQLYVSRGDSYLIAMQYKDAAEDFRCANLCLGQSLDIELAKTVAFRAAFGEVVSYDNLGMQEEVEQSLQQLQAIAAHAGCDHCIDHAPCGGRVNLSANRLYFQNRMTRCTYQESQGNAQSNFGDFNDIVGPNRPVDPKWCEEVVTGTGRSMDAIACLAPNYAVRVILIGIIEALITRGIKCCEAGGFWKACVAPIARKWKEWKNNKEERYLPNANNLDMYTYRNMENKTKIILNVIA